MVSTLVRRFEPTQSDVTFMEDEHGERWALAKDVFTGLGLSPQNVSITLERHVFPDYRRQFAIGRGQPAWYLKYEGLIQLGMMAKSQFAESFQRWAFKVIREVLETGRYEAKPEDQKHFDPLGLKLQIVAEVVRTSRELAIEPEKVISLMHQLDRTAAAQPLTASTKGKEDILQRLIKWSQDEGSITTRMVVRKRWAKNTAEAKKLFEELSSRSIGQISKTSTGAIQWSLSTAPPTRGWGL